MKLINKRIIGLLLAMVMLCGMMPMTAFAVEETETNPWSGRSAVFVGDSITAGSGTTKLYYRFLEESLGFGSVTGMGIGGSCISNGSDYGNNNTPLINRYKNIPSADLIQIFMGTNDYGHATPIGSPEDTQAGTFYGALNTIIPYLLETHKESKIVFVTPLHRNAKSTGTTSTSEYDPNASGHTMLDYVEAIKQVCAMHGVSVIDLYTESEMDPRLDPKNTAYFPDGLHPNAAGHELIAGIMESHIREYEPVKIEPIVQTELIQGNKFSASNDQPCRASSRVNYYLKAGTVITLRDPDVMQWACAKTNGEISSTNLGYFPDSQWTDKETAVVAEDGWVGFVFKYRDETQVFDLSKSLSEYITIEEPHTHSYKSTVTVPTCTEQGYTTYTCDCGDSYVADLLDATGHTYENGICTVCGVNEWDTDDDGVLEILVIGNSFSVDALQYAYQIAQNLGIEGIVIGNLYKGSCTLATHAKNAKNNTAAYAWFYNDNGTWSRDTNTWKDATEKTMGDALQERTWDFVSLQQASGSSGQPDTYNADLDYLIQYVSDNAPGAKLVWHMTWAYQQNTTHSAFPTYGKDQMTMYNAIVSAVQTKIVTNGNFDLIVPNGTAVQNSRTSLLGDTTTIDGYHMSRPYGRYLTSLMFVKAVTGLDISDISYMPSGVSAEEKQIAIESVNNAYKTYFAVTESAYQKETVVIPEGYVQQNLGLTALGYWNSSDKNGDHNKIIATADNSKQYYATVQFTREQLPVDSVILLADGWQYRPEGWITDAVNTNRPVTTTEPYVVITEEWWSNYTLRAFNISKVGLSSLSGVTEADICEAFQIYVPTRAHIHTYTPDVTAPTCTEKGYTTYTCECGDSYVDDYVDATGHTYKNGICTGCDEAQPGPVITRQPVNGEAKLGERYMVDVKAEGEGLKYQWYIRNAGSRGFSKSSVKTNTYSDVMTEVRAGREVYCVITDANGNSVKTDTVKLVLLPSEKLEIITQPTDGEAVLGERYCVTVEAKGEGIKYQWYYRNAGSTKWYKSGVRDNTYNDVMTKARAGREVYCVITDRWGNSVTTDTVKLIAVPTVELKLLGVTYEAADMGERYCVTVEAEGEGLTYTWYFRNAGATRWSKSSVRDNTYDDVMNRTRANREVYCVITDAFGNQITTEVITLTVEK